MSSNINLIENEDNPKRVGNGKSWARDNRRSSNVDCSSVIWCCICLLLVLGINGIVVCIRHITTVSFTSCNEFQLYSRTHDASLRRVRFLEGCDCEKIVIGNESFGRVRELEVDGLSELESIVIGRSSFTYSKGDVMDSGKTDGKVQIRNCPKLRSIQMGAYSFSDYHSLVVANLPMLESVEVGNNGFYLMLSLSLSGLNERKA